MKEHTDIKQEGAESHGGRYGGFKKKKGFKKHNNNSNYIYDIFRGVGFKTGKEGPKLYARKIGKIGLYASAHFKNGADVKKFLKAGKVIKPKMTDLADNHTDSIKLLGMIKQIVYTSIMNDLNKSHNRAMAHLNLMNLHQDRFQDIQEFCDPYIAFKKDVLNLV